MRRPVVVPRSPPPPMTTRWLLMGLIGSGMCPSDVTWPQLPAERPFPRIAGQNVRPSLVRAPARPPRQANFGSQSHTPADRCLRFGPHVTVTPARLAPVPLARLWTDQTCTGKLIPAFLSHPASGSHLGCLTAKCPYTVQSRGHACPARGPARVGSSRVLLGPRPSLHRLLGRSPGSVRQLPRYYGGV